MTNKRQYIISLEGIDGAGKSTLIEYLNDNFKHDVIVYRRTQKSNYLNQILSLNFFKKNYMFQVPFYILLSNINYIKIKKKKSSAYVIMDRCFLSNLCYFFPQAITNKTILRILMFFEPPIMPQKIFIIDVDPRVGQERDNFEKSLEWLNKTRMVYLSTINSQLLKDYKIQIIEDYLSTEEKAAIIMEYFHTIGEDENGHR